jgi:Rieske Fe-S protein
MFPIATMSISSQSQRRVFLQVLGATGLLACGGRVGDSTDDGTPSDPDPATAGTDPGSDDAAVPPAGECGGIDVGPVDDFQPGHGETGADYHLHGSGKNTLIVANDDGSVSGAPGIFAMSALCTHARCPVQSRNTYWYCRCHGARFDYYGATLTKNIARRDLPHYAVSICNGEVLVDTTQIVDPSTRAST